MDAAETAEDLHELYRRLQGGGRVQNMVIDEMCKWEHLNKSTRSYFQRGSVFILHHCFCEDYHEWIQVNRQNIQYTEMNLLVNFTLYEVIHMHSYLYDGQQQLILF